MLAKPGLSSEERRFREDFCVSTKGIEFATIAFDADFARRVDNHRRRAHPQKTPDCMPYAFVEALRCDAILSNDARFVRASPIRAILTDDVDL